MIAALSDAEILGLVDENLAAFKRSLGGPPEERSAGLGIERGAGRRTWTRSHVDGELERVLELAGFAPTMDVPVMILDGPPPAAGGPVQTTVRRVTAADDRAALRSVVALADPPAGRGRMAIDAALSADAWYESSGNAGFVALDAADTLEAGDTVVAAAMSFSHGPMARIVWAGTIPTMRRRGFGSSVVRAAIAEGARAGARLTVLESSPSGEPFYRALGFRTITRYRVWTVA
ncbi:MAG: GNAT family N-acetyltransferase [Candidatus Limnocylindrales bacterium]